MSDLYRIKVAKSALPHLWVGVPEGHQGGDFLEPRRLYAFSKDRALARAEKWCKRHSAGLTREAGTNYELTIREKP